MSDLPPKRRINIEAQDRNGDLLSNTEFRFELRGKNYGCATSTHGRTDVEVYGDEDGPLVVTATHGGQSQTEKVGLTQDLFVFTFKAEQKSMTGNADDKQPKRGPSRSVWLFAGLLIFALLAIGLTIYTQWKSPEQRAAESIANTCAGGHNFDSKTEVTSGLTDYLTKAAGKTSVSAADVGTVTGKIKTDAVGFKFYESYTGCLSTQTNNWLRLKGVAVAPAPALPSASSPDMDPTSDTPAALNSTNGSRSDGAAGKGDGALKGYIYYEELDGRPTQDGPFAPPGKRSTVPYLQIKKDDVLKSQLAFEVRSDPGMSETLSRQPAGTCVRVLSPPTNSFKVLHASSGGRLHVAITSCP